MGKHDVKLTPKQRLLRDNPWSCHCGGNTRSTTVDHVPPQAAILNGRFPEDHEFPGCDGCNGGTKHDDHTLPCTAWSSIRPFRTMNGRRSKSSVRSCEQLPPRAS